MRRRRGGVSLLHFLGNTMPMVSGIVTAPFTARALGVDGRATMVLVTTLSVGLLILGTLGLGWITRQEFIANLEATRVWKWRALRIDAITLTPAAALGVLLSVALGVTPAQTVPLTLVVTLSTTSALRAVWSNALIASGQASGFGLANLLHTSFVLVATVSLYFADALTLATTLWVQFLALAIQTIGVAVLAGRIETVRGFDRAPGPWLRTWRVRIGRSVSGQIADFGVARSDLAIVGLVGSRFEFGLYSVPGLIPIAIYQVSLTVVQHSWSAGVASSEKNRAALSWQISVVAGAVAAALSGLGVWLIFLPLFGDAFSASESFIFPACLMGLALSSIVPAVQHSAISSEANNLARAAIAVVAAIAAASVLGQFGPSSAVGLLAASLFLLGAGYTVRAAGWASLIPRPSTFVKFVRGA